MVLIFNSIVSHEISGTNFTHVRLSSNITARGEAECYFIATQPNTREIYPEFHSYSCYCIYIYMEVHVTNSACHAYVLWAELGHCHFLYVPAVFKRSNHWKRHGHKMF